MLLFYIAQEVEALEAALDPAAQNSRYRFRALLHEMRRRGPSARYGVISMCIGSGMGAAAVLERGDV